MALLLDRTTLPVFQRRLLRLNEHADRLWGIMTPVDMAAHLRRSIEISLGEVVVKDDSTFIRRNVIRVMAIHLFSFPRGVKAPEIFFPERGEDLGHEMRLTAAAFDRFVTASEKDPARKTVHPFFGPLTLAYWRRVNGKHTDHHFRQFSI